MAQKRAKNTKGPDPDAIRTLGPDAYSQQSDAQPLVQQSGQQLVQSLHLSVQQVVQHPLFAVTCEVWPKAVTARTTATDKTANMRFI